MDAAKYLKKVFFENYQAYSRRWWPDNIETLAKAEPKEITELEQELLKMGIRLDEISEPENLQCYLPQSEKRKV